VLGDSSEVGFSFVRLRRTYWPTTRVNVSIVVQMLWRENIAALSSF